VGGGNSGIAEYARSSVSHSALLADDMSYITPHYIGFTAITAAVERDDYVFMALLHTRLPEITLMCRLLWLRLNVLIIYDKAQSEIEYTYTKNILFPNVAVDETDKSNITLNKAEGFTLTISQFPTDRMIM
jgi:hypothetical protein